MRGSNLAFKREFPEALVRGYAQAICADGFDAVILGHFHIEKELPLEGGRCVYVLPEWKGSRRHLEADGEGLRFVDS